MFIEAAIIAGVGYAGYKAYKDGKLNAIVTDVEARVASLETKAEAEVAKVVTSVETAAKKAL